MSKFSIFLPYGLTLALRAPSESVLMLGVSLPAQLVCPIGPFAHVVTLVEHAGPLPVTDLYAGLCVIATAGYSVVEGTDVPFCRLLVEGGHAL